MKTLFCLPHRQVLLFGVRILNFNIFGDLGEKWLFLYLQVFFGVTFQTDYFLGVGWLEPCVEMIVVLIWF